MRNKESDGLIKKYLAAESTLDEEKELFKAKNQYPEIEAWGTFVKQKRVKVPRGLNDSIWASIQTRKRKKQRFLIGLSGIAASVALFMVIFINSTINFNNSYEEKEAVLKEALSMFPNEKHTPSNKNIIYEDELIIIYVASE